MYLTGGAVTFSIFPFPKEIRLKVGVYFYVLIITKFVWAISHALLTIAKVNKSPAYKTMKKTSFVYTRTTEDWLFCISTMTRGFKQSKQSFALITTVVNFECVYFHLFHCVAENKELILQKWIINKMITVELLSVSLI